MNNHSRASNRQIPLWDVDSTIQSPVILTNEQEEELTTALAELLLLSLGAPAVEKGESNAE